MFQFSPTTPLGFLTLVLGVRVSHARQQERGASAVEWIVISAILIGIVIAAGTLIATALGDKATEVGNEIQSG